MPRYNRPSVRSAVRWLRSAAARTVHHRSYDYEAYWRSRAAGRGQGRVLWSNEEYDLLYRQRQLDIIDEELAVLGYQGRLLDIGCGVGYVAHALVTRYPRIRIDAVDLAEMVDLGRRERGSDRITYIASRAEDYQVQGMRYDLVLSSACYAAIKDLRRMKRAIRNGASMLRRGGTLLMMDPFHRCNFLARAKISADEVVRFVEQLGLSLKRHTGVLFWPYREWLANSDITGEALRRRFAQGETLLRWLGPKRWADYQVLVFCRPE